MKYEMTIKSDKPNFTNSQQTAVNNIIDFIAKPFNEVDNIRGLSGAGGTGKTFVLKYIIRHSKWNPSMFTLTAPTHKACRVLEQSANHTAITIQSCFGFKLDVDIDNFDPNRPEFRPIGKTKINSDNTKVLVIDEASMLNYHLVNYIKKFCAKNSIKILFCGDASQLPPVNENTSRAFSVSNKVFYLNEIVRQEDNNPISDLLKILRSDIDNKTFNFLTTIYNKKECYNESGKGYKVFTRNEFPAIVKEKFNDVEFTTNIDKYRLVAYTNRAVTTWNKFIRQNIIENAERTILNKNDLIMSYNTIVNEFNDIVLYNSEEYIIEDIANYVDPVYTFKGFLCNFRAIHGGGLTKGLFILNHNDSYTINRYYTEIDTLVNNAKSANKNEASRYWKKYFDFKRKYLLLANLADSTGKIMFTRDIDYGFAITSHRAQGSTYENVFVDINDICYDKYGKPYTNINEVLRRLYVACSRVRNNLFLCYG